MNDSAHDSAPGKLATLCTVLNLSAFCLSLTGAFLSGVFALMLVDASGLVLCLAFIATSGLCFRLLDEAHEAAES